MQFGVLKIQIKNTLLDSITDINNQSTNNDRHMLLAIAQFQSSSSNIIISNEASDLETKNRIKSIKSLRFPENKGIREVDSVSKIFSQTATMEYSPGTEFDKIMLETNRFNQHIRI